MARYAPVRKMPMKREVLREYNRTEVRLGAEAACRDLASFPMAMKVSQAAATDNSRIPAVSAANHSDESWPVISVKDC